jgi:tetratricopeptide (TPR) repeat protein
MKCTRFWVIPLALTLAACTAAEPAQPRVESAADAGPARAESTDPEVMYRVMSGEVLGADGDTAEAAYQYLEAAMESEDPAIAARATRVALAAHEWQYAAMAADRWALLQPESLDARQTAARTMMVVGDYVGAEHQLSSIIEIMAHVRRQAWVLVADLLSSAANPEKTRQVMNNLVLRYGGAQNSDAQFAQSILLGRQGSFREAMQHAEAALEVEADHAHIHAWVGRLAVNLGQESKALEHYQAAWALRPAERGIAMAYAELLRRNDQPQQAQDVLASLEDTPGVRFARIAFALDSGYRELAEQLYGEFETASYPNAMERAFQAAQAAELLDWRQEAIRWYALVEQGEHVLVAALRRAFLTAEGGDVDAARRQLEAFRLSAERGFQVDSFIAESEIMMNAGMEAAAFELLSGALGEHQPDPRLLYSRAILAVQLDRLETAEQDLRKIIELEPQNATALNALGYTLADRTDRFEEAERLIHMAYALEPDEASIIDSMGWVAYRLGRMEEAVQFLNEAWSMERNAEIGAHLGEVLWVTGDREAALEVWQEAVEVEVDNTALRDTLRRYGIEL